MTDEDEASNPFAWDAKGVADAVRISAPASDPAGSVSPRSCGEEEVHSRRSARQYLLPHRNLVVLDGCRNQDDEHSLIMCEVALLIALGRKWIGIVFEQPLLE